MRALLRHVAGGEQLLHQLECAQVRDMDDGAMGSLEFAGRGHRFLASCLVDAEYLDRDGVPVSVALNSYANGLLYELDMWKVDFAPLFEYPNVERVTIDYFKRECVNLESRLSAAVKLTRLNGKKIVQEEGSSVTHDDFLRWLQFCVTGINEPVLLPSNPMYLDALIGGQELWAGVVPKIGRKFLQAVAIEGFPLESAPGILTALGEQPCEYRWSSRFIFMDSHEAVAHLDKFRKKWKQKIRGFFDQVFNTNTGVVDEDAMSMVADAQSAIAETNSGLVSQGYYTSVVILMDEDRDRLEAAARMLERAINRLGFTARIESINTLDAFLGSLPGHGVENVRRPLIHTMNLADLLPTSTIWTGLNSAPCPLYPAQSPPLMNCVTHGSTPFRFNLHYRDLGHTLMLGPTRAGKSTKLALIAMQARRYAGMSMYPQPGASAATTLRSVATTTGWPFARSSSWQRKGIGRGQWNGSIPSWP